MKATEIRVGGTYCNRGAGRTQRTVLAIGNEYRPKIWWSNDETRPDEPGVLYEQKGIQNRLYISSFAQWCGREVR